jgi:hypothetical protein
VRRRDLLSGAARYTANGWHVFILSHTKRPVANCDSCRSAPRGHDPQRCACLTCHGFYAATTDLDRVRAMLNAVPRGLLAIRTGAVSGLVIVDIDPAHGGRLDRALMPPTAAVASGGAGWHLYYAHPGGTVPSRPMPGRPGIDIKADGGYVVAPPSLHPHTGRQYQWVADNRRPLEMPPELITAVTAPTRLTEPRRPPAAGTSARTGVRGDITNPDALLAAHLAAVARAPEGRRRTTLYGAARGVARMVAAGALSEADAQAALTAAGRAAEQSERDIARAIEGGFRDEGVAL